ncbi:MULTISPECIES: sulfite exporter TauE/SafE family protein [unclassified Xanthobacter]|uniref:sulfite exporter TauE/SafE family protein n=1 Tax=unclassified Xanthobacter TaxID=2623496 RepID=UPI001EDFA5C9|nr:MULTISPECIES: sulfite exporter TauE/SafE family protein [unclassified Xanthobacter]
MLAITLVLGTGILVLAGVVKGVIGMGLPTVGVGLLSLFLAPAQAAALLIVPSAVTNVWQFATGPRRAPIARRFLTMMIGVACGTLLGGAVLGGLTSPLAHPVLGATLVLYGLLGLSRITLRLPTRHEPWLSPLMGFATGLITGTTGVSVMPAAPYLQALALERDDLVQALGLTFTVSTFALALTLALPGSGADVMFDDPMLILASGAALLPAVVGMELGRVARLRLDPATFRKVFFGGLAVLGVYMVARGLL